MDNDFVKHNLESILNSRPIKYKFSVINNIKISTTSIKYYEVIINNKDEIVRNYNTDDDSCLEFKIMEISEGKFTIIIDSLFKCAPIQKYGIFILESIKEFASNYGYYSVRIGADVSSLIFNFDKEGNNEVVFIDLYCLSILSTGESWYNRMGFYSEINREQIIKNKLIINQPIQNVRHLTDSEGKNLITSLIDKKIKRYPGDPSRIPECYRIIDSYENFRRLYNFILQITEKTENDTIEDVFKKIDEFIRRNCDSIEKTCRREVEYSTIKKISCFIEFMFKLLELEYDKRDLEYIVPRYNVKSGKLTKRIYNSHKKTKKQFLFNPNNPKKSFDVYIDKNPKDTINIKYTTVDDVKNTIKKLEKLYKNKKYTHKRIWQVGMIMKVRLEVLKNKKPQEYKLSEKYFKFLGERTKLKNEERYKFNFKL